MGQSPHFALECPIFGANENLAPFILPYADRNLPGMTSQKPAGEYLRVLSSVLSRVSDADVADFCAELDSAIARGGNVFIAGNGGSAATASHFVNDLIKTIKVRGAGRTVFTALADNSAVMSAIANDEGYERVFASQLETCAGEGDLLVVLSASGNSPNILAALSAAKKLGLRAAALLGMGGGEARKSADISLVVASDDYGIIEDAHLAICHAASMYLRAKR